MAYQVEGLEVDNKHKALICFLVVIGAANVVLSPAWLSPVFSHYSEPNMGPHEESLRLLNLTATQKGGSFEISLIVVNTNADRETRCLKWFEINHVEQRYIMGLEIFLNGTKTESANGVWYDLKSGDAVQVDFVVPAGNLNPARVLSVQLITPNAMIYRETELPPII
jgi:hypothetical protein